MISEEENMKDLTVFYSFYFLKQDIKKIWFIGILEDLINASKKHKNKQIPNSWINTYLDLS